MSLLSGKRSINEHLPDRKIRALDIGCGGGNNCIFLSGYFQSVLGIDISDSFLKIAQIKADEKREYRTFSFLTVTQKHWRQS